MAAVVERYMGIGIEPVGLTQFGPFVTDTVVATGTEGVDRDLERPSFIEVEVDGGTDNTGTVTVTGLVNGASTTEDFVFTGPGGAGKLTVKGAKLFTSVTDVTSTGLDDEGTPANIGVRVSDRLYVDYMTESLNGANNIIKADKNVRSRHSRKSNAGNFSVAGDVDMEVEPENGLMEFLTGAFGVPVIEDPKDGVEIETGLSIGTSAATTQPTPAPKRLIIVVNSFTTSGTITISGDVNGVGDSEVIAVSATGTFFTTKAFDSVVDYVTATITVIDYDVKQADSYRRVWEPCDELPSLFARIGKDGVVEKEVQGLKVGTLELGLTANEPIVASMSFNGRTELENPIASPTFSDLDPFVFHKSTVTRDGSTFEIPVEMTITQTNTLNMRSVLGSRFVRDIEVEGGETSLAFLFLFEDHDTYRRFWGGASSTSPAADLTSQLLEISLASFEKIFDDVPLSNSEVYSLKITMHKAFAEDVAENVNSRDVVESTGTFYLEEDATADATISIELINGIAA